MTAKEKVLKVYPNAYCKSNIGYTIVNYINDCTGVCLSHTQSRESWAWAQALRFIKKGTRP